MAKPRLQFDEATHTYRLDGAALPSVTTVLKETGFFRHLDAIPERTLEHARQRGTDAHRAIQLYIEGRLDWSTVTDEVYGRVEGFANWCVATGFKPARKGAEVRVYHPNFRYAGTIDAVGAIGKRRVLVDYKTPVAFSKEAKIAARLQMAAYQECLPNGELLERVALHLPGDGAYSAAIFPAAAQKADFGAFLNALSVVNYRRNAA